MELIQAWLMITAAIMLLAAILYALEIATDSFDTEGIDRELAKMFFFAPLWPLWLLVYTYFFIKCVFNLIVSMWKDMTT